jgi:hypothetical protein
MRDTVDYIGYVEGRDINRGKADVVVTDGFTGNVALKTMEGFASFLLGNLREVFGAIGGRIAYLLIRKRLGVVRERLDPAEYGGAPLLGLAGATIIAHGSSNPRAIRNAIRAAANEALIERVNLEITEALARHVAAVPVKPAGKGFRALLDRMRERLHRHPKEAGVQTGTEPDRRGTSELKNAPPAAGGQEAAAPAAERQNAPATANGTAANAGGPGGEPPRDGEGNAAEASSEAVSGSHKPDPS